MFYNVGSIIEYSTFSGSMRRILVTGMFDDVKNGRPGFDGELVKSPGRGFANRGVFKKVWGYDSQVTRVVTY